MRIDLLCELLKVLFNVTVQLEGDDIDYTELGLILISLLDTKNVENSPKQAELNNQIVNLLTNVPISQYGLLVRVENDEKDMKTIDKLLEYLSSHFDGVVSLKKFEVTQVLLFIVCRT